MIASKKAIVLVDPVTEWREVVEAAKDLKYHVIALQMADATPQFAKFLPTQSQLIDAGVAHTITMKQRDVFDSTRELQIFSNERGWDVHAVLPLSEIAVEISDIIAAGLRLPHNGLDLVTARRDKGIMKQVVASKGLKVAKHARVKSLDDLYRAYKTLSLSYPVVVKTPAGMSTSDVYICSNNSQAENALHSIVGKISPDGRVTVEALLEEYIHGTEFAVNLMNFSTAQESRMIATDMWRYNKNECARYVSADICNPGKYPQLVDYAKNVAEAVGIQYGAAHIELKAILSKDGTFTNPTLIEVGARLSGGKKSTMANVAIDTWNPFSSLILSHCAGPCPDIYEPYLSPNKFVRHVFLPIEKWGQISKFEFNDSLETIHSASRLVKVGDVVNKTTDIVSCAGFVWFVGDKEAVDRDTRELFSSFVLAIDNS